MPDRFPAAFSAAFSAALLTACALALPACSPQDAARPALRGQALHDAPYARDFHLIDADGQPRSLADFKGKVVVVFFGYTQCPDVCPTTLLELAQARQKLGAEAGRLQGIFITLDPARDTPEVLKAYVASFDESFIALTPRSPQELAALAREFKIFYRQTPGPIENSYTLDHTAASYMYDPQGRLRLYQTYGIGADAMAANALALLHEKSADRESAQRRRNGPDSSAPQNLLMICL